MLEYSVTYLLKEVWKWKTVKSNTKVPLLLMSVTGMAINIITICHSRNGFNSHFILPQIILEMINEIFNYRLCLS